MIMAQTLCVLQCQTVSCGSHSQILPMTPFKRLQSICIDFVVD